MMLRWSLGQPAAAEAIEKAVADALVGGYRTPDLVAATGDLAGQRRVGTQAMADAVVAALEAGAAGSTAAASTGAGAKAAAR
jgi:3-isopropylmalate dehydrogenase